MGKKTTTSPIEAAVIVVICFGMMIVLSLQAVATGFPSTPFSDAGMMWLAGTELVLAMAALLFLGARGFSIGTLLPEPTLWGTLLGALVYGTAWIAGALVTLPFIYAMPEQPYVGMVGNAVLSGPVVVSFAMVNATFEEVFLLGVLVRGLRGFGLSVAVGVPLFVRLLYHLYQGPVGALWVMAFGLVMTLFYVRSGDLWPPVFAHILGDIVPFA
jgi:membrane protease YdiL (CAAX protease family)